MADAFEEFQAKVQASERVCAESDLYWRTNRWAEDGRDMTMKLGPINVVATGSGKSSFSVRPMTSDEVASYSSYRRIGR
jgi:hypothetical protein